jgi:hypothetical protein
MANRTYSASAPHTRELFNIFQEAATRDDLEVKGMLGLARVVMVAASFIFASIFFYLPGFITFTLAATVGTVTYDVARMYSNFCDLTKNKENNDRVFNNKLVDSTVLIGPFLLAYY